MLNFSILYFYFFVDGCKEPKVEGRCDALFERFYFNTETFDCEKFNYGGCGGNFNNFETKQKCLDECKPQ